LKELKYGICESSAQALNEQLIEGSPIRFFVDYLIFFFFPALVRGDIKWGIIQFVVSCLTVGISCLVFPFIYNKIYVRGLLEKGYLPADEGGSNLLASRGIMMASAETTASTATDAATNTATDETTDQV
jgi:hypothetical protein